MNRLPEYVFLHDFLYIETDLSGVNRKVEDLQKVYWNILIIIYL